VDDSDDDKEEDDSDDDKEKDDDKEEGDDKEEDDDQEEDNKEDDETVDDKKVEVDDKEDIGDTYKKEDNDKKENNNKEEDQYPRVGAERQSCLVWLLDTHTPQQGLRDRTWIGGVRSREVIFEFFFLSQKWHPRTMAVVKLRKIFLF